jgi:hypothetical protein
MAKTIPANIRKLSISFLYRFFRNRVKAPWVPRMTARQAPNREPPANENAVAKDGFTSIF